MGNITLFGRDVDQSLTDPSAYLLLVDKRQSNNPQLWAVGGSDVHGQGVDKSERFGQLLADQLNFDVTFLTKPSSSIEFQADQVIRSDIQENDIVVWGLPPEQRFPLWSDAVNKVLHITPQHRDSKNKDNYELSPNVLDRLIASRQCFYQSIAHIYQVANYCNKVKAKLLVVGLGTSYYLAIRLSQLSAFKNYKNFQTPTASVDFGTDGEHPGPKQHQLYADFCYSHLKQLQYI